MCRARSGGGEHIQYRAAIRTAASTGGGRRGPMAAVQLERNGTGRTKDVMARTACYARGPAPFNTRNTTVADRDTREECVESLAVPYAFQQ